MLCSDCGTANTGESRICVGCGVALSGYAEPSNKEALSPLSEIAHSTVVTVANSFIGRIIEGRYRLDALVGIGGMAAVYRAARLHIGDEVAVKILHPAQIIADPHTFERFRREAQTAARLKHPNAVTIYDFGISGEGLQYLVMEFIEGQSLRQIIRERGLLTTPEAVEIITQVCAALDEAHRQGIVHRDIKPDNIMVQAIAGGLRVKVLDFGIAKLRDQTASSLTQTGSVMGTPYYMSPEQCLGEGLDNRSDIYSLGVVLYEMLAGVVPFNAPVSTAVVVQHVNQPPPSLREKNGRITAMEEAVVLHALEKQREARPQTAGSFALNLKTAISDLEAVVAPARLIPAVSPGPLNQIYGRGIESDEITAVREPVLSTPVAGSITADTNPTVHLSRSPAASGELKSFNQPSFISAPVPSAKKEGRRALLVVSVVLSALIISGFMGMFAWSERVQPNSVDDNPINTTPNQNGKPSSIPTPPSGMAYIPGGEFLMGSNDGDDLERPQHKVTVGPFFIDRYEVTCEDYEKFVRATGHQVPDGWKNGSYLPGAARRPVTGVDWDDANAYARWAGKRLPTEEEWEFAARGSDGRRYPWGDEWSARAANAEKSNASKTAEANVVTLEYMRNVGEYPEGKSPYGVFDMIGNAWEWTATELVGYEGRPLPKKLSDGEPPVPGKVIRGGCYLNERSTATTTYRRGWDARDAPNYKNTGFRCVKDVTN